MNVREAIEKSPIGRAYRRDVSSKRRYTWYRAWIKKGELICRRFEKGKPVQKNRNFKPDLYRDWQVRY